MKFTSGCTAFPTVLGANYFGVLPGFRAPNSEFSCLHRCWGWARYTRPHQTKQLVLVCALSLTRQNKLYMRVCVCGGVTSLAQGATRSSTIAKPPHMSLTKLGSDFVFVKLPHSGGRSPTTVMLFLTPNGAAKGSETGNPTPSSPLAPRVAVATHSAGFPPAWRVNGNGAARRAVLLLGLAQSGHHREGDPRFKQVFLLHRRGHLATEPTNAPSYFTREINA